MSEPNFSLRMPRERTSCAVFSSPHSGSVYPAEFLGASRLGPLQLRSSEDAFVDELFATAPGHGAPLLAARVPRACVDLNRAPDDLDPALIAGAFRRSTNPRIAAGLGVIPRVVAEGRPIIDGKMPMAEAERRIADWWRPYHGMLGTLLAEARASFGTAILFDCQSMPHDALTSAPAVRGRRPDLILGDRFGASCDRWLAEAALEIFASAGFVVTRNAPFAGGYITQAYGAPRQGVQALQIEIDRALYMDEARIERLPEFSEVATRIGAACAQLAALGPRAVPMAAE
jgi:N-formylglutamate deformylase